MATTDVAICNMALSAIATRSTIASLNERSAEAQQCNLHYTPCLEAVLRAAHWNFARKQANMTLLKDGTVVPNTVPVPWVYEYAYPSDALQPRYIMPQAPVSEYVVPGGGTPAAPYYLGGPVRFLVGLDNDPNQNPIKVILTNQYQAILVYTCRVTNPNLFDADFVTAFAALLGSKICLALTGDKAMMRDQFKIAADLCALAAARNGNEGITIIDSVPDWIRVRGYLADWAYPSGSTDWCAPQALQMIS